MLNRLQAKKNNDEGFTLVEMLIVIVVLGILAGITVFGVSTFRADANTSACSADAKTVQVAAEAFNAKSSAGAYPTALTDLTGAGYLKTTPKGTYTFSASAAPVQTACS